MHKRNERYFKHIKRQNRSGNFRRYQQWINENSRCKRRSNLIELNNRIYTDDDARAEAEYNTKTASIQVKEKRLQNDLQQVETQQKACDTEIDSVKKVMEKNIERTFKVFS